MKYQNVDTLCVEQCIAYLSYAYYFVQITTYFIFKRRYFLYALFIVCSLYMVNVLFFSSFATNTATNFIPLHWYLMHFIFVPVVFILIYASGFNKIYYVYYFTQIFYR